MTTRWGGAMQAAGTIAAGLFGDDLGHRWVGGPPGWEKEITCAAIGAGAAALAYALLWDVANPSEDRFPRHEPTPPPGP